MGDEKVILKPSVTRTLPESTLCAGGICTLPEAYIALQIPDGLSEGSFRYLRHWIEAIVALAEKRRRGTDVEDLAMSEDYAGQVDKATGGAHDPVVRSVIEQLDKDVVSPADRGMLRRSVDSAEVRAVNKEAAGGVYRRITGR